jgi:hypothetical protein
MGFLYYLIGTVISYFILVMLLGWFLGGELDLSDPDDVVASLGFPAIAAVFWPITLPLSLAAVVAYKILQIFEKKK